jgi:hypothetical protein
MRFADYATKASNLIDAAPRGAGYPRSIAATFDLAISEAVAQCPTAGMLMVYLAHCAPERIPMILVEGGLDDEAERTKALAGLAEVSLLRHDPFEDTTPAVTLHRLVQTVTRVQAQTTDAAQYATKRVIERLVAVYPVDVGNPRLWPLCAQLAIGEKLFGGDKSLMQRYAGPYALMLLHAGRADEALTVAQSALATQQAASNGKHPWTARVTAHVLDELDRIEEAKALRERYNLTDRRNEASPTWRPI